MAERFAAHTVVVTGAGRGIGRAIALAFAREGASLALLSRTHEQLLSVAAEIRALGGREPMVIPCDVAVAGRVAAAATEVTGCLGPVDVLVNCAGVFAMAPTEQATEEQARQLLDTNVLGTLFMCQEIGRGMLARGQGRIVNFASLLSFTAFPQRAAYAASKGAVLQLTRVLGVEWAGRGVAVNAVAPGMIRVETPHPAEGTGPLTHDNLVRRIPMGRRGHPDDLTGPVLFLASPDAGYITGQTLVVDGGWLAYGYL